MKLDINGQVQNIDVEPNMPLLWAIREVVGLTVPSMAVVSPSVVPVPSTLTVSQCALALFQCQPLVKPKLLLLKRSPKTTRIQCNKLGLRLMFHSVAIASLVKLWLQQPS